jgi:hypothetical protein
MRKGLWIWSFGRLVNGSLDAFLTKKEYWFDIWTPHPEKKISALSMVIILMVYFISFVF